MEFLLIFCTYKTKGRGLCREIKNDFENQYLVVFIVFLQGVSGI